MGTARIQPLSGQPIKTLLGLAAGVAVLSVTSPSMAQIGQTKDPFSITDRKGTISVEDIFQYRPDLKKKEAEVTGKAVALDGPVNPAEYYVGPNDVFALIIWSSSPVELQVTVTPEATLLVPNVGSIDANGLTLAELKKRVTASASKRYPNAEITLTLVTPRKISVRITGNVFNEGTFEVQSVQRANNLIATANELLPGQTIKDYYEKTLPKLQRESSKRNILIRHRDGTRDRVDLVRFESTHLGRYNPYLREGDEVYVPECKPERNAIAAYGAVKKFGEFEFVPGDSLTDLIEMGYGLKPESDSTQGRFSRLSADASSMETEVVDLKALLEGRAANVALRPGDRLFVPERNDPRRNYFVAISGEVGQPGHYAITKGKTKLSEVIRMAGGFTRTAAIQAAYLVRTGGDESERKERAEQELLLSRRSNVSIPDSSYFHAETELRVTGERVSVDFHSLFVAGDSTQDVLVQPYDKIIVPPRRGTVYVFGQVTAPGHIPLVEGRKHAYYIEKAGGFTDEARTGDVRIIKAGTRAWLSPGETTVEDGDYIWVPKEPYYPFSHYLTTYTQIASIIGVVATVALLVYTVQK